jgi:TPP-dependent pyruvate/acetoin dehydrogenase alpha subunit
VTADERAATDARVVRELDGAVAEAEAEPLPEPATALEAVYAHPPAQPGAWYREAPRA